MSDPFGALLGDEEAFRFLVLADSKGEADPDQHAWLRTPGVVHRWHEALQAEVRNILGQLAANAGRMAQAKLDHIRGGGTHKAWELIETDNKIWRSRAAYAQRKLENTMAEARRLMREANRAATPTTMSGTKPAKDEVRRLRAAIHAHRDATLAEDGYDPTPLDEALWAALALPPPE